MSSRFYIDEEEFILERLRSVLDDVRKKDGDLGKLCSDTNLDRTAIWRMAKGDRKLSIVAVYGVCHYTRCNPKWLLFGEGSKYPRGVEE